MPKPYASYDDVKKICPWIDQIRQSTDDDFDFYLMAANIWLDNAVRVAAVGFTATVVPDRRVIKACAYKAASEILATQITPLQSDNAYEHLASRFQRVAENELSTLIVRVRNERGDTYDIQLGVVKRGSHG
jgi:hypothetical protein